MPPDERLTLRVARLDDLESTRRFYVRHAHPFVDPRRSTVLDRTVAADGPLLLVDVRHHIVGAAAIYDLAIGCRELGSIRIAYPGGFGLFEYLMAAQILRHLGQPNAGRLLMNVDRRNTDVIARSEKFGWTEIDPDPAILRLHDQTLEGPVEAPCWWAAFPPSRATDCLALLRPLAEREHSIPSRDGMRRLAIDLELADVSRLQ